MASDIRREVEREALEEYHDIVRTLGAEDLTFEACWELYRQNIAGRLITAVITCGGLDLNDERSYELAEISMRRTLTAIEDLEATELIPARRRDLSSATVFSSLSRVGYNLCRAFYRP